MPHEELIRWCDPREQLLPHGDRVLTFDTCICPTELKIAAAEWRRKHEEAFEWAAEVLLANPSGMQLAIRDLKPMLRGRLPLADWMPELPEGSTDWSNTLDAWVGRAIVWFYPELYDAIPRSVIRCFRCGFGYGIFDEHRKSEVWDDVFKLVATGVTLGQAQLAILPPPDDEVEADLIYLHEKARRDQADYARKGGSQATCALCGELGWMGSHRDASMMGYRQIHVEHGIPKARWEGFFGRPHSPSVDRDQAFQNLWQACAICNLDKGVQTLSEYLRAVGIPVARTHNPVIIQAVLDFETEARQAQEEEAA